VRKRSGWGFVAAAAIGLAACGGGTSDIKRSLEPGGGFKAEVQQQVVASIELPDRVSPDAALIEAEVALVNKADDVEVVTVPRSCDVYDWVLRDPAGQVVMTKDPVECVEQPVSKALAPGSELRERVSLYLLPNVLRSGQRYIVDYRVWGQPAHAEFTATRR
jgi:hypothetical protein